MQTASVAASSSKYSVFHWASMYCQDWSPRPSVSPTAPSTVSSVAAVSMNG